MHPTQSAIFKHVVDEYNFFIISNLFVNNEPYAQARIMENVRTNCIIIGETLRFRGKNFKQNLLKNCSKSTEVLKWPLQNVNFQKFSGGACPQNPPRAFFILNMLQNNSAGKKLRLKI